MKRWHFICLGLFLACQFAPYYASQIAPQPEVGVIQGMVTRAGTSDPLSNVQLTLEGGAVDPQAMQLVLNSAAAAGIVVTPPAGASLSEITQLLTSTAAARGLPIGAPAIQNMVNQAVGGSKWPTTSSDQGGRFIFRDVRPGRYTVRAQREGYFGKAVGGTNPPTAAIDVTVAGKEIKEAPLSMIQGAIIGGRIYDATGQLLSNVNVQAFTIGYQNGYTVMQPAVSKLTDDRGEYRLFWVPPGDYYIGVAPRAGAAGGSAGLQSAKTFYPGAPRLADASLITIRGGEDLSGIDIGIRVASSFKISGQVNNLVPPAATAAGLPVVGNAVLMLVSRDLNAPDDSTGANRVVGNVPLTPVSGNFEVPNIQPGAYDLFARVPDPNGQGQFQGQAWGRATIDIRDSDVEGVTIVVNRSVDVKGTVSGVNAKVPPNVRIVFLPDGGSAKIPLYQLVATRATTVAQDGSFTVTGVPEGRFRVGALAGLPEDLYLADVRQDFQSVFDSGFDVSTSRASSPIEIVVGAGAGVVEGIVQESPTKLVAGATVALVPEGKRRQNRALYLSTTSDASGRFTLRGIAPGDYKLFAWESVAVNAFQNSGFLAKYEERGRVIHVGQRGTINAEVTVIPAIEKK